MKHPFSMETGDRRANRAPWHLVAGQLKALCQRAGLGHQSGQQIGAIKQTAPAPSRQHRLRHRQATLAQFMQQAELAHAAGIRLAREEVTILVPAPDQSAAMIVAQHTFAEGAAHQQRRTATAASAERLRILPRFRDA